VTLAVQVAEDAGFEPARGVAPTRFPSVRHRPLGESSAHEGTRPHFGLANRIQVPGCRSGKRKPRSNKPSRNLPLARWRSSVNGDLLDLCRNLQCGVGIELR
jgi:hypothetical protein